jgi:hypothetical protein
MYYAGDGMTRDYVEAYIWLSLAAAQGIKKARGFLDTIEPILTRARASPVVLTKRPINPF